jgi:hypothetical protein
MKKTIFAIGGILLLIFFIAGCSGSGSNNQPDKGTNFHKGTTALKMVFLPNSPPDVMYDGQSFPFSIEFTNTGAADTTAYITLSGHDQNIIMLNWDNKVVGPIPGKSEGYPIGGYGALDGEARMKLPDESESYPTTIKATACYPYITEAVIPVCVDPDPTNNKDDVCTPATISISEGQGAPVTVKSVSTRPTAGISYFTITIQNMGTGEVLKTEKLQMCMDRLPQPDLDVVEVVEAKIGVRALECNPPLIRLVNKIGTTTCKGDVGMDNAYTSNLLLNLKYGYKDSITKPVIVRRT